MNVAQILSWLAIRKKAIAALVGTVCLAAQQELPLPDSWRPWVSFILIVATGGSVWALKNATAQPEKPAEPQQ